MSRLPLRNHFGKVVRTKVSPDLPKWTPLPGAQSFFIHSDIFELLFHGTRGPGKTDALLMSFAHHVGYGYGGDWCGVIFRRTYPELQDIISKSMKWFPILFPSAHYNQVQRKWTFRGGETLCFRHMKVPSDYFSYHGHSFSFIGWEELTTWPNDECYRQMMTCCRTSNPKVPLMIRSTTNPYGPGHQWVKDLFNLHGDWRFTRKMLIPGTRKYRGAVFGHVRSNKHLLAGTPDYMHLILQGASSSDKARAWSEGSWAALSGGIFSDCWDNSVHVLQSFDIPHSWRINRSFDWGSSAPFSVGWWAESDGSDYLDHLGASIPTIRGDLFRIAEWYGCSPLKRNVGLNFLAQDIGIGIRQREYQWGLLTRVHAGPADTSIFNRENGNCIADDLRTPVELPNNLFVPGPCFLRADKKAGSRKIGWDRLRYLLKCSLPRVEGRGRELPGLFIFSTCDDFIRTVPNLMRSERDPDDIDTRSEDHIADETRYRIMSSGVLVRHERVVGAF